VKIWSVVIAVMLIFGAGVVTGGLLVRTRVVEQNAPAPTSTAPVTATPMANVAPGRQMFIQRVRNELDLTPEQSAKVDEIMAESQKRIAKIYEPVTPQAREETRRVRQEIMGLLTPEQRRKFNQSIKRQREMTEDRRTRPSESNTFARPQ
jgi:Spy/CpxP family protein refolding chaperone